MRPVERIDPVVALVRRIAGLPRRDLVTMAHALAVLLVVESLIRWVRIVRLARLLGVEIDTGPSPTPAPASVPSSERVRRVVRCTNRVTRRWPLSNGPCLRRALVAGHLVRDLDPRIRFGVADAYDGIMAHAWLELDGAPLEDISGFSSLVRPAVPTERVTR